MATAEDFLEYLELQQEASLITKSELIEQVRGRGLKISDRLLTYYSTEGLIPKSVRIGSRSGAYPAVVADLLAWVIQSRNRGVAVEAIKEMLPVWKWLQRSHLKKELNLSEFELVARNHIKSPEAMFALPPLVYAVFDCPQCLAETKLVLKDGSVVDATEKPVLSFALVMPSSDSDGDQRSFTTTLTLPVDRGGINDPQAIVLELPAFPTDEDDEKSATPTSKRQAKGGGAKTRTRK